MEKYPRTHPCNTCLMQQKLNRLQKFWDSRNTKLAMGIQCGPLTGLSACQKDIREMFCDSCKRRDDYLNALDDPYWHTYPQDDNHHTPQYDTISLMDVAGLGS